jgi:ferredoxin
MNRGQGKGNTESRRSIVLRFGAPAAVHNPCISLWSIHTRRIHEPPLFPFRRRTPPVPAPDPASAPASAAGESSANEGRHGEGPGTLVTVVGSGAVHPVRGPLPTDAERLRLLARGYVDAVEGRCVQCGICSYNCPMGIDVRSYSRVAAPVLESHCILCGECVARCPRGVLRFAVPDAADA